MNKILLEDKRSALLSKSKRGTEYAGDKSKGKNRYQRRLHSRIASSVKHFNAIDMDKLFKADILDVTLDVTGETNIYQVRISFTDILEELHKYLTAHNQEVVDRKAVMKALTAAFNSGDVYVNCTCPDFRYRFKYWCTIDNTLIGDPENRPIRSTVWHFGANKDDPNGLEVGNYYNDHGSGCKHVNLALSDASWLIKVASVIYNYIIYMQEHQERLYQKYLYPAIYQEPYENRQLSIFDDDEEELSSDEDTIKTSNQAARERGRFKTGNEYRFKKKENPDQIHIDDLDSQDAESEEILNADQAKLNREP